MDELSPDMRNALEHQKENCIFCKIIGGSIPAKKVVEDDHVLAILDISPASRGHILLMPKEHYPIMPLLPVKTQARLFEIARLLCVAQKKAVVAHGSTIFIANGFPAGQQSQHFMIHLIPRDPEDGLALSRLEGEELPDQKEVLAVLSNNIPLIVEKRLSESPRDWHAPVARTGQLVMGRSKVIQVIEQNPKLKELILNHPQDFIRECKVNDQLKSLFFAVDPKSIVEHYLPGIRFDEQVDSKKIPEPLRGPASERQRAPDRPGAGKVDSGDDYDNGKDDDDSEGDGDEEDNGVDGDDVSLDDISRLLR